MLLIAKGCRDSQAGRRRFDPGLPLHVFNGLKVHIIIAESRSELVARFPTFSLLDDGYLGVSRGGCMWSMEPP
jgi:hypothetical protein